MMSPGLSTEQRQALELLASDPHGAGEELLVVAHGFDSDMIAGLVRSGFATANREIMKAGGKTIEFVRITITDAGRRAIEGSRVAQLIIEGPRHLSNRTSLARLEIFAYGHIRTRAMQKKGGAIRSLARPRREKNGPLV
jgi:hypothetical protein